MPSPSTTLEIGEWRIDAGANELTRGDEVVRVEPKVMEVLLVLAATPGATVSRATLIEAVWPDVVVGEDALSSAISKLRSALGDTARSPRYVETIPKGGYRLIASVAPALPAHPEAAVPPGDSARVPTRARWLWGIGLGALALAALGVALWRAPAEPSALTAREIVPMPGTKSHPALSPDGQTVAFTAYPSFRNAMTGTTPADLYVQGLGDGAARRLTETPEEERFPTWLPEGRIAFLRCAGRACRLYAVSSLEGRAQRLAGPVLSPWGLAAHPDGSSVVAVAAETPGETPLRLVAVDLGTGETRPLTSGPASGWGDSLPAISPDGRQVAFLRATPDGTRLAVIRLGDAPATPRFLPTEADAFEGHAWTSDGTSLVVAVVRDGRPALLSVDATRGDEEPLPLLSTDRLANPTVRGDRLVVASNASSPYLYAAASGGLQVIGERFGPSAQPALSPDGARVAHVSDRSGDPELWTLRTDGTDLSRLTTTGAAEVGAPRWSPDGRRIVFERVDGGRSTIVAVSADGGTPTDLTDGAHYDAAPRWSPDGQTVYFASTRSGGWEVWRVAASGGAPERVTTGGGFSGTPTPDGRALLFTRPDRPGLWRRPIAGGSAVLVDTSLAVSDWGSWDVASDGVVMLERSGDLARLVRIDLDSGRRETLLDRLDGIPERVPALTLTPDASQIVLSRLTRAESTLLLIEAAD